jgi:membrane-anchored protein YejM (alkaline phosphatase superfamily)
MAEQTRSWLTSLEADDDTPWFAYYSPYGPHAPGTACPGCSESQVGATPDLPNFKEGCPGAPDPSVFDKPSFIQAAKCTGPGRTNGKLAQLGVDNAFRDLYDHLTALGELDDTVILFMSDNGMALNSHRVNAKTCAYEECHTIPFMLKMPGSPGGDIERMISNLDVYSTLLDIARGTVQRPQDGMSILPLLSDPEAPWRTEQFLWNKQEQYRALREDCAVRNPCWLYVEYENGERELYDLHTDPYQLDQLLPNPTTGYAGVAGWEDPDHPTVVSLRTRLADLYAAGGGTRWP